MTMNLKRKRWILAALATILMGGLALAGPGRDRHRHHPGMEHGMGMGPGAGIAAIADELGLPDAQVQEIHGILAARRTEAEPLMKALKETHERVRQLAHAETLDEQALRDAVLAGAEIQADLAVQRARGFQAMMAILTPEQQTRARELLAERAQSRPRGPRRGSFGRGPGF